MSKFFKKNCVIHACYGIFCIAFVLANCCILLTGCADEDMKDNHKDTYHEPYEPASCDTAGQNEFVFTLMKDRYLWDNEIPVIDYLSYDSPESLLDDIMYKEYDQWSYITSKQSYDNLTVQGKYIGIGFNWTYDALNNLKVVYVLNNSPADQAGLKRGDIFLEVNGIDLTNNDSVNFSELLGEDLIGVKVYMKIQQSDGQIREIETEKQWVTIPPILYKEIITYNNTTVGYFVFRKFYEHAIDDLDNVFKEFKQADIQELVLDLRYNPGGRSSVAQYLSSLIASHKIDNSHVFAHYYHNERYKHWNSAYHFKNIDHALSLDRIFIITSDATCSASEAVINSLTPFIDVILIGEKTCGKPAGMYGNDFCDKHISPIQFSLKNHDGFGDYFDGFDPTCSAKDDIDHLLGDPEEDSLKETLFYMSNGHCSQKSERQRLKRMSENIKRIELKGFRREIGAF